MSKSFREQSVLCERCNQTFTPPDIQNLPPLSKSQFRSPHFPLNPENLTRVLSHITDEERQLQTCLSEITRVRRTLKDLENYESRLETRLAERRSLLNTYRKLPTEIWTEIFSLCIPSPGHHLSVSESAWNKVASVPYTLSHVCTRWRDIITSFPDSWSSIWINLYGLNRNITPILESYFDRSSKGRGPRVFIRFHKGSITRSDWIIWKDRSTHIECLRDGPWTPYSEKAFSFVLAHSARFRTFSVCNVKVDACPNSLPILVHDNPHLSFTLLESLTISTDMDIPESPPSWLCDAMKSSPKLQVLKFDSTRASGTVGCFGSNAISNLLSGSPIKTLDIGNIRLFERQFTDLLYLLPSLRNLEVLRVDGIQSSSSSPTSVPDPLPLPARNEALKSLSFGFGTPTPNNVLYTLLDSLDLPSLDILEFKGYAQKLDSEFLSYLQKFPLLRNLSLAIHLDDASGSDIPTLLLHTLPRLESLDVCIKRGRGRGLREGCITSFFDSFGRDGTLGSHLRKLTITESDVVLTSEAMESVISSLETRAIPRAYGGLISLLEVMLVFGGWRHTDMETIRNARTGERFRVIEGMCGTKCAFFYTSWGSKSFVFGSKVLDN